METQTIERITRWIVGLALPLVLVAFIGFGTSAGIGAIAGAVLALASWTSLRWLAKRLMVANDRARGALMALLVVQMGAVLALASILLRWFDGLGFAIGFGSFVLGALFGALHGHLLGETSGNDTAGDGIAPAEGD